MRGNRSEDSANAQLDKRATKMMKPILNLLVQTTPVVRAPEKPKFRQVLVRAQEAAPGEVRKTETSDWFKALCAQHEVPCTHRQASKYLAKRGRLWKLTKK